MSIIDESINAFPETLEGLTNSEIDSIDNSAGTIASNISSQTTALTSADSGINENISTTRTVLVGAIAQVIAAIGEAAAAIANAGGSDIDAATDSGSTKKSKKSSSKNKNSKTKKTSNKKKTKKKGSKRIGTRSINQDGRYLTQEDGGEIITTKDGVLIPLKAGDGVIPAQLTEKLFELAREGVDNPSPSRVEIPNSVLSASGAKSNVTVTYGSLLTVNGNVDKEVLPSLKTILQESYEYTQKKLSADMRRGGMRRSY